MTLVWLTFVLDADVNLVDSVFQREDLADPLPEAALQIDFLPLVDGTAYKMADEALTFLHGERCL